MAFLAFTRNRYSLKSKVFFFQARGYSVVAPTRTTFSHIFEMALRKSKFTERICRGTVFYVCESFSCIFTCNAIFQHWHFWPSELSMIIPFCKSVDSRKTENQRKYKDVSVILTLLHVCLFLSIPMSIWFWRRRNIAILENLEICLC